MKWRFYIADSNYYGYGSKILIEEPIGWNEALFTVKRDKDLHGIFFSYSLPLKFYGLGYQIIKEAYDDMGVEAFLRLIIEYQCSDTDVFINFYNARVNFTKISIQEGDICLVTVPLEDDSCLMLLKSRQDQEVDLTSLESLDGAQLNSYPKLFTEINLPPKTFVLKAQYEEAPDASSSFQESLVVGAASSLPNAYSTSFWQVGFNDLILDEIGDSTHSFVRYATLGEVGAVLVLDRTGTYSIDLNFSALIELGAYGDTLELISLAQAGFDNYAIDLIMIRGGASTTILHYQSPIQDFDEATSCSPPDSHSHLITDQTFSESIALDAGDEIELYLKVVFGATLVINGTGVNQDYNLCHKVTLLEGSYLTITLETNNGTTPCDVSLINEALSRTVEAVTNDCLRVYSEYFGRTDSKPYAVGSDGYGSLECITTGLLIRQIVDPTTISFQELFNGLSSIHALGMGIEEDTIRTVIEYSWDVTDLLALSDVQVAAATKTLIINTSPFVLSGATFLVVIDYLNTLGFGTFILVGNTLSVESELNEFGTLTFSPYVSPISPSLQESVEDYDWVRIEPIKHFYKENVVLTLDKVPEVVKAVISNEHVSVFEFGYSKWEAEQFNGLDEFATKRKYRTTLQTIRNTVQKLSDLVASGYAIEITKGIGRLTSQDWRYDKDVFIICLERSGGDLIVEQGNITSPANLLDPDTVYNFRISPNRNALRWAHSILASYNEPAMGELVFMTGDGNIYAAGLINDGFTEGAVLSESEEFLTIDTFAQASDGMPAHELEEWKFDCPLTVQEYEAFVVDPSGIIKVRYGLQEDFVDCYLRQMDYRPNQGLATFTVVPKTRECADGIGCWILELDFIVQ